MIMANGVWNVEALPTHYVVEHTDGSLSKFYIAPFRILTEDDFTAYKGHHPRKMKGLPMPDYLYQHYGLDKSPEGLTEVIRLRVSPSEKEKIEAYCKSLSPSQTVSELLRDYLRSLIHPKK